MKNSFLLIKPQLKEKSQQKEINIFEKAHLSTTLPTINKTAILQRQPKIYDFVGPTQFKLKRFYSTEMKSNDKQHKKKKQKNDSKEKQNQSFEKQVSMNLTKLGNTTINRETILSKLSKHEQIEATKQKRNIDRHREYQLYWNQQGNKLKRLINKKHASFIDCDEKVIVEDNPDKLDIINNNVVHYWQMSLRNHHPTLKRHIKGHRYDDVELEEKLQRISGTKEIQASIPKLPSQALKKVKSREFSLSGRSKSFMENQSFTERSSFAPFSTKDVLNQQEVYLINYQGQKKWQGTQNFY